MRLWYFCECEENDLIKCNQSGIIRTCLQHNDRVECSLQWKIRADGSADRSKACYNNVLYWIDFLHMYSITWYWQSFVHFSLPRFKL